MPNKSEPSAWRHKLPGIFFELAKVLGQFERQLRAIESRRARQVGALTPEATDAERAAIDQQAYLDCLLLESRLPQQLHDIDQRHPNTPFNELAYSYLWESRDETRDDQKQFPRLMHWFRHRESLMKATMADATGDLSAYGRISRTGEDVRRAVFRKGGLKPFKVDLVHQQFLELILCYAREPLTGEELAECADTYCGCGKPTHDADAIRKQYARLVKDLEANVGPTAIK